MDRYSQRQTSVEPRAPGPRLSIPRGYGSLSAAELGRGRGANETEPPDTNAAPGTPRRVDSIMDFVYVESGVETEDHVTTSLEDIASRIRRRKLFPSINPDSVASTESAGETTFALVECAETVVGPVTYSMSLLGWQPLVCLPEHFQGVISGVYFILIVLVFFYDYTYNILSCVFQSQPCGSLVTKYIIPPMIHFSSYMCGAYYFRARNGMDTSRAFIEAVFLQSLRSSEHTTAYGDLSQTRLARKLRYHLWAGVVWLAMRMVASGLTSLFPEQQELIIPGASQGVNTLLSAIKVCTALACDAVYALTITVYAIHCCLIAFYIDGWRHRINQRMNPLRSAVKEVTLIQRQIWTLNNGFGWPISLAFLQFAVEMCTYGYSLLTLRADDYEVVKVAFVAEFFTWGSILVFTLWKASTVTRKCASMKWQAMIIRNEGYMNASVDDLDSFLLYLMNLKMDGRVFGVRVTPAAMGTLLILSTVIMLILFRANMIAISWF